MPLDEFESIKLRLREFARERDWEKYHSPKNLAMALLAEAGELIENFQWLTEEQSSAISGESLARVGQEIADVQIYLIRLADQLGLDIPEVVMKKLALNKLRYRRPFHRKDLRE